MNLRFRTVVAVLPLSIVAGAINTRTPYATQQIYGAPTLSDLKSVDELKTLFNQDRGKPRLVLLLSPT